LGRRHENFHSHKSDERRDRLGRMNLVPGLIAMNEKKTRHAAWGRVERPRETQSSWASHIRRRRELRNRHRLHTAGGACWRCDEPKIAKLQTKLEAHGSKKVLPSTSPGKLVQKGDRCLTIYSPEALVHQRNTCAGGEAAGTRMQDNPVPR